MYYKGFDLMNSLRCFFLAVSVIFMLGCAGNPRYKNEPLKVHEGIVIATVVNKYNDMTLAPHFLFSKDTECVGFATLAESNITYIDGNKEAHVNILKMPKGKFINHNWGLYYNAPPTYGSYHRPFKPYYLEIDVAAGEVIYLGKFVISQKGLSIENNWENDSKLVYQNFPKLKELPSQVLVPHIESFKGYKECK